jgi:hypothetical protein
MELTRYYEPLATAICICRKSRRDRKEDAVLSISPSWRMKIQIAWVHQHGGQHQNQGSRRSQLLKIVCLMMNGVRLPILLRRALKPPYLHVQERRSAHSSDGVLTHPTTKTTALLCQLRLHPLVTNLCQVCLQPLRALLFVLPSKPRRLRVHSLAIYLTLLDLQGPSVHPLVQRLLVLPHILLMFRDLQALIFLAHQLLALLLILA